MARTVALILVALCALAAGASATPLPAQSPAPDVTPAATAADVAILDLDTPARANLSRQSLDVATAVAMQREQAQADLERRSLAVRFERASDEQQRREILFEAATDVEIEISALRSTERDLWGRYVAGEISTTTFLSREAVVMVRAAELRQDLEEIRSFADEVPRLSMSSRVQSLEASLTGFDGPVVTRVSEATTGEGEPVRLYVSASANGTALSTIDGNEYVRQGFRSDNWLPDSTNNIGLDEVEVRAGEIYPTAFNSTQTRSRGIGIVTTGIYRIEVGYAQGSIVAYLDGDTRDVFFEVQRRDLAQIETGPPVTTVDNGTRLTANRTFAGGPLRISVTDAVTGDPVDATVEVAGVERETGADGVLWTLMPDGEARITATTARGSTSLDMATASPTVAAASRSSVSGSGAVTAEPRGTPER